MIGSQTRLHDDTKHSHSDCAPPTRVMALHALLYCERLFYLEEVEEIRVADAAVYAGRRLHDDVVPEDDETAERRSLQLSSEQWGIFGKVDAVRRRDGSWVAYEHKRGRCRRDEKQRPQAWPSDRIQAIAYAVLLEEEFGEPVPQARVRYHADNVTAFVEVDEQAKQDLAAAIERGNQLRAATDRPPVTENENLCPRCSLAPVCLPEEERLTFERERPATTAKLFPSDRQRETLHVLSPKARLGRSGDVLVLTTDEGKQRFPIRQVDSVMLHGFGQISSQAVHLCASNDVAVHWMTGGGRFIAGTGPAGRTQQRLRQYRALADADICLRLARQLVLAKVELQLKYLMRATRSTADRRKTCEPAIARIRESLSAIPEATSLASLLGHEGMAAKAYFSAVPHLLTARVPHELHPEGRNRRPPRDRFNALLSYGYALVQGLVHRSVTAVGLEPALGFYHQPRSAAPPLVLDMMELFRTLLWEMPLIGSLNRDQWSVDDDFDVRGNQVWLSSSGRRQAIQLFELRLKGSYKHPHTGQALTYFRMVELEVRLLEKEWSGSHGHFAQLRLR